jgi:hypothetical protein
MARMQNAETLQVSMNRAPVLAHWAPSSRNNCMADSGRSRQHLARGLVREYLLGTG